MRNKKHNLRSFLKTRYGINVETGYGYNMGRVVMTPNTPIRDKTGVM